MKIRFVDEAAAEFLDVVSYYEQNNLSLGAASRKKFSKHCFG
jgi:hypothetical protein